MVTFEEFEDIAWEIADMLPKEFYQQLNGGIIVQQERKIHPESIANDLSIMGEYVRHKHLGRYIVLYYGSFMVLYGHCDKERIRKQVRKTILHEFRHHLESLAGERGLEIEDAVQIAKYKEKNAKKTLDETEST